jgi:hypothetical protein
MENTKECFKGIGKFRMNYEERWIGRELIPSKTTEYRKTIITKRRNGPLDSIV